MQQPLLKAPIYLLALLLLVAACSSSDTDAASDTNGDSVVSQDTADVEQNAPVSVDGERMEPMPEGLTVATSAAEDPEIGTVVPTLSGTAFDGTPTQIAPDGRAKAVMFLAHWCPHCQAEVEVVTDLVAQGQLPAGLDLYAVTIAVNEDRDNYPPSEWLEREGFTGKVLRDSTASTAADAVAVGGIPYVLYLDGENRLLARSTGSLDNDTILQLWLETAAA